jgi:hypothetical protein
MPLLAAILTATAIFVGSALAYGSPPPQPPFPYPQPGDGIGYFPPPEQVIDCGQRGTPITGYPLPRHSQDSLTTAWIAAAWIPLGDQSRAAPERPRLFLAKNTTETKRWRYLLFAYERKRLAQIDFRKCAVLAAFIPGNLDVGVLGVRLNDRTTLTVGLATTPHRTGHFCGTTTSSSSLGSTGGGTPTCTDIPPAAGVSILLALPAEAVSEVQQIYGITQAPPPPLPCCSTTGTTTG